MGFPSEEQQAVIDHRGRPLVVVAGPGTGKTRTLVERMIRLVSERVRGRVAFTTFTRASRRDTAGKLDEFIDRAGLEIPDEDYPTSSTLHTYAKHVVNAHARGIGRRSGFSVMTDTWGERMAVFEDVVDDLELPISSDTLSQAIVYHRAHDDWADTFPLSAELRSEAMGYFERLLGLYDTYDVEGLVTAACRILGDPGTPLGPVYLQVDEFQDLNRKDQELVSLSASHGESQVVVVGDDAQSIYGRRHAHHEGLKALWASGDWEHVGLSVSHRLPAHILRGALALMEGRDYLGCEIDSKPDDGKRIRVLQLTKPGLQCEAIAQCILRWTSPDAGEFNYRDFMVLCPTGKLVTHVANVLTEEWDIPTRRPQKPSMPHEFWLLVLVLRMIQWRDSLALRQWLPRCGYSGQELAALRASALSEDSSFFEYCRGVDDPRMKELFAALARVRSSLDQAQGFRAALRGFPHLSLGEDLFADPTLAVVEASPEEFSIPVLIRTIYERHGLLDSEPETSDEDAVLVSTMHSAKGLEAEYVFLAYMNGVHVPGANDPEEERRVLYVALTRAKRDVIVTFYEQWTPEKYYARDAMCPFLTEIDDYISVRRVTAPELRGPAREA